MNGKTTITILCAALWMTLLTAGAHAADKACVELKTTGETESEVVENGQKVKRLVPAAKAVPGTDIAYSLDGKEFKSAAELQVRAADGAPRAARADEYRAIRWTYRATFAPGATAFVRYRAVVK